MSVTEITESNGTKTYLVYVNGFDSRGKRVQMKRRGIESLRKAEALEFEMKRQIANMKDGPKSYSWDEWFAICLDRMRIEMTPATLLSYTGKNRVWIEPVLKGKMLGAVSAGDVHGIVYNSVFDVSWYTRKTTLKIVKRILQMAVEEGVLPVNPALRVKVRVPQVSAG